MGYSDIPNLSGGSGGPGYGIIQTPDGNSIAAAVANDSGTLTSSDSSVTITSNPATDTIDFKANAPTNVLKTNGTNSPTADIDWGNKALTNVASVSLHGLANNPALISVGGELSIANGKFKVWSTETWATQALIFTGDNAFDLGWSPAFGQRFAPRDIWSGRNVHVGNGLAIKEGTNQRMGVATLVAGTVTVANTSVTANTRIFLQRQADGGTIGASYSISRTAGTSFTITSKDGAAVPATQTADTSTVAWLLVEPE